jgi:hypothetical protein
MALTGHPEAMKMGCRQGYFHTRLDRFRYLSRAMLALARRRVNVLWAMLRDGQIYQEQTTSVA